MKAVIFDMDGVIDDSEPIWIASKQQMLREQGIEVPDAYHHQLFGMTLRTMWTKIQADFNLPLSVDACITRGEAIRQAMRKDLPVKSIPGSIILIQRLFEAGIPLAIASSSSNKDIALAVDALGIRPYFQVLVSGEDCARSKPFPDVFLKAADALGVKPETALVIEDAVNGVKAAKAAGMVCLGFENPAFTKQDLREADGIIRDLSLLTIEQCQQYFGEEQE